MTVVDASAVVAILRAEPDADRYLKVIDVAETLRISAVNHLEAAVVVDKARDPVAARRFDQFIIEAGIRVEPVIADHARIARDAYRDYGKGSGHQAGLNFGDCFAYALAKSTGEPLLFKGDDFVHTDIESAIEAD